MKDIFKKILTYQNLVITAIVLSGVYCNALVWDRLNASNENNSFYVAQLAFFMLIAGCFGAYLIHQKNKWIGWLAFACSLGLFKTFLFANASRVYMFESALIGFTGFFIYYFVRHIELEEDYLKWFLIPACANIALVFIQFFDNSLFLPLPTEGISGFLGREGFTAAYLALCMPLFVKYFKKGIIFCYAAILMCDGAIGLIAATLFLIAWNTSWMTRREFVLMCVAGILGCVVFVQSPKFETAKGNAHLRLAMAVGTLDGIKHNPVLGWGVGSFIPIISQIKPENSGYLGIRFNSESAIMHHPHNELLSGWWKIGIAYPVLLILAFWYFLKSYNKKFNTSFSIVIIGAIVSMGWFFTLPTLFLFIVALGVYENSVT